MLTITIPGGEALHFEHLVIDFNGTLACDGALLDGVAEALGHLARQVQLHVVTGDSFGTARAALRDLPCDVVILAAVDQAQAKAAFVERIGPSRTACIGNGRNDRLMLGTAALGIAVMQAEGTSTEALLAARVVVGSVLEVFNMLLRPQRLVATLRP